MLKPNLLLTLGLAVLLSACDTNGGPIDTNGDAGDSGVDQGLASDPDAAVPCDNPGHFSCGSGVTYVCECDGFAVTWVDGPCWGRGSDAGVSRDCTANPTGLGCPCETENAVTCRTYDSKLTCVAGVWAEADGTVMCCGASS